MSPGNVIASGCVCSQGMSTPVISYQSEEMVDQSSRGLGARVPWTMGCYFMKKHGSAMKSPVKEFSAEN